jgi:hypothetical protein
LLELLLCGIGVSPASATDDSAEDAGIKAFKEICLASAPSFANAAQLAKKFGVEAWIPLGKQRMGMTKDQSVSIQIQPDKECAITSKTRPGPAVHNQFINAVSSAAKSPAIAKLTSTPFIAAVAGKKFIFKHDRNGGEAYVMLRKD